MDWFRINTTFFFFNHITGSLASESLQFKLFSNCKEGVQVFLENICLAKLEEVKDGQKILRLNPFQVDQWMRMFVSPKYFLKERTGGSQDNLMSLQLLTIFTGQGYVSEIFVISEPSKCKVYICFEIIPLQTKLFRHCC